MARVMLVALLLSAGPQIRLSAQLLIQPSVGLRYTTTLVHDSIVTAFDVRPALAPAFVVTIATPLRQRWTAGAALDFVTSELRRHDANGTTADLGRLSALAVTVELWRELPHGFVIGAEVGGLKYLPADQTGIFRAGTGGVLALGGAVFSYAPTPGAQVGRWRFGVEARYDVHQFITPALRNEGFTSARTVHRVALTLRVGRSRAAP